MRLGLQQPYLFPHLDYYRLLFAVDRFIAYDDVAWIRRGWIHRNKLLVQGRPVWFTVPTRKVTRGTPIHDVEVHSEAWRTTLRRTIVEAYARAPYRDPVLDLVDRVFGNPSPFLADLAIASLALVAEYLGYGTPIIRARGRYAAGLRGQDRIIAICLAEGATEYVNASGGRALYDRDAFARAGVSLRFLNGRPPADPTAADARLSVLHTLMHNPVTDIKAMMTGYDLD